MFILTKGNHAKIDEGDDGVLLFDTSTGIGYRLTVLESSGYDERPVSLRITTLSSAINFIRDGEVLDFWSSLIDVVEKSNQHNSDYLSVEMNNWLQAAKLRLQGVK